MAIFNKLISSPSSESVFLLFNDKMVQKLDPLQQKTAVVAFAFFALMAIGLMICHEAFFKNRIVKKEQTISPKLEKPGIDKEQAMQEQAERKDEKTPLLKKQEEEINEIHLGAEKKTGLSPKKQEEIVEDLNGETAETEIGETPIKEPTPFFTPMRMASALNERIKSFLPDAEFQNKVIEVVLTPVKALQSFILTPSSPDSNVDVEKVSAVQSLKEDESQTYVEPEELPTLDDEEKEEITQEQEVQQASADDIEESVVTEVQQSKLPVIKEECEEPEKEKGVKEVQLIGTKELAAQSKLAEKNPQLEEIPKPMNKTEKPQKIPTTPPRVSATIRKLQAKCRFPGVEPIDDVIISPENKTPKQEFKMASHLTHIVRPKRMNIKPPTKEGLQKSLRRIVITDKKKDASADTVKLSPRSENE